MESEASDTTWTCSMHPQIRQPNFGLCPICEMDLIPLQDSGEGGLREISISPEASALLDVRVSPVNRIDAAAEVSLFGRIQYDERRISTITSRIAGRIDRLFVDFTGAQVRKGDHLAELYSPEIYVAQKELIEASKALRSLPSSSAESVRAVRRRLRDAAVSKLTLLELPREQIDDISQQAKPEDRIVIQSPQKGVVVEKSVNEGQYIQTGESLFRIADLSSVWLILEAYESDLPLLRYAQQVSFAIEAIPGETFTGRIAFIDPELDPRRRVTKVRVNVENPKGLLKPGMFATAKVDASLTGDGKVIEPSLAGKWISPMHPEIVKDSPGQCDICGMDLVPASEMGFADKVNEVTAGPLSVPESAVLRTGERAVVYVRLPDASEPTFEGREILLGAKIGDRYVVDAGLSEGDLVVTKGTFKLDSELQLKAKPSMMNPNAGLSEQPAHSAPEDLRGQWEPVRRSYSRMMEVVRMNDVAKVETELRAMHSAIEQVNTETFQPDLMKLWTEFSNRLKIDLTRAQKSLPNDPGKATLIAERSLMEAGRYLGLAVSGKDVLPVDPALADAIQDLIKAYLPMAKALADDQAEAAQRTALDFAKTAQIFGIETAANTLAASARQLAAETNIKAQRVIFEPISNELIKLIRQHGLDQVGSAYVVHCPMAFGNKGADWISAVPEVLNPYFGDAMLTCGTVTETLSLDSNKTSKAGMKHGGHQHE